ncbi:MAG: putative rane protein [Herbinix sp.]|jgi:ABC-type glutathione transport system ATPase component|nr:putative rane protein [Herbinix sp.]
MRTNNITDATKLLIFAAAILITCTIVTLGLNATTAAKDLGNVAVSQMTEINSELADRDLKMYDGLTVSGSEVVNVIKKQLGDYSSTETAPLYINVKTKSAENTYKNSSNLSNIRNFNHAMYIKPTATFLGKVVKDLNQTILGISFSQQ